MLLTRLLKDSRGGAAPLLALGMIPLMGAVGAAMDYSRANAAKAAMQAAIDSAALMAIKQTQQLSLEQAVQQVKSYFHANFSRPEVRDVQITTELSAIQGGNLLTLFAQGIVDSTLIGLLGFSSLTVTANASVSTVSDGLGCVLSLDPSASGAFTGKGSTSVALKGCSLYVNSSNDTALSVGGSARISAFSVGVVGGIAPGSDGLTAEHGIRTGIGVVADPYADVLVPNASACTEQNFKPKETQTISPGVYCGGISINAGVELTLSPGLYFIDGGTLSVNGGATLTGTGVTLVFTSKNRGDWASATINGNANIHLTPPQSGPTAGIVIFGDRGMPANTTFKLNGGSSQYFGGAVYVPGGAINWSGGSATSTTCTQIIGNTVTFTGNSALAINCSSYRIRPFSAPSIRLLS